MQIRTSDLIDTTLDYAVALCEGTQELWQIDVEGLPESYSNDPAAAYTIVEREGISIMKAHPTERIWAARYPWVNGSRDHFGATPFIAAMRCYVATKLGDFVELPDELAL